MTIHAFLCSLRFSRDELRAAHTTWARGRAVWDTLPVNDGLLAVAWWKLQKPGSQEWRPSVILRAVNRAIKEQ